MKDDVVRIAEMTLYGLVEEMRNAESKEALEELYEDARDSLESLYESLRDDL